MLNRHIDTALAGLNARAAGRHLAMLCMVLYLVAMPLYLLLHGGWPTVDYLIPPLLLLALALGRGWSFVLDWGPFLLLILLWQATAGIADQLGRPVHVAPLADADRWLFGGRLPTPELQAALFNPDRGTWYDWVATLQHSAHFVLPVAVGLVLWLKSRRLYWRYLSSVLILFGLGFIGYALFPAAPPWMAGLQGETPLIHRIAVETVLRLPSSAPVGLAYTHMSANQVAAMPSLHAALPMLLALILVRIYGWSMLPSLLYPLTMGFNLVYLGEHYVVDVLAGYAVAFLSFALAWILPDALPRAWLHFSLRWPTPSPVLQRSGAMMLPALAILSITLIVMSLRPGRPVGSGPVIPGLQVQAGEQTALLTPVACDEGASPSTAVDAIVAPTAGRYAVYLFDLESSTCHVITANVSFPPPRGDRAQALAGRAPFGPAPIGRLATEVQYAALRTGPPAAPAIEAGLPVDHHYLIVVELGDIPDIEPVHAAVDTLAALVLSTRDGPEPFP